MDDDPSFSNESTDQVRGDTDWPAISCTHAASTKTIISQIKTMKDFLLLLAILAGWFALNAWILPKFGFST